MKKEAKKRGDAKSISLELSSSLEWDDFKAKILYKMDYILKPTWPSIISFDDYIFTFTIPRIHPKVTSLDDENAYKFMVGRARKSKDPNAVINVEPIIPNEVRFSIDFSFKLCSDSCIFRLPMTTRKIKLGILVALRVRAITERRRGRGGKRERKKRYSFCVLLVFVVAICYFSLNSIT
jgi:hypothetical protein